MHDGQATISPDILARYAADAVREVDGVHELYGRKSVKVEEVDGSVRVEVHLSVDWGASIVDVGSMVRERVREYLTRMTEIPPVDVDVVVDEIARV